MNGSASGCVRGLLLVLAHLLTCGDGNNLESHALSENDARFNMADGYLFFEVTHPDELAYTYKINPAWFAAEWNSTWFGIGLVPTDPACGCGTLANNDDVEGNVALVQRGECSFQSKVIKAQEAGAVATVITDWDEENDELFVSMQEDLTYRDVKIPAGFLLGKNGQIILNTLQKLRLDRATINIPFNVSHIPPHKWKQPPWIVW